MTARPLALTTCVVRRFSHEMLSIACKGYSLYGNLEARVISTELQYHFPHETFGNMPACDSPCVCYKPHSPVVSLAMQLVIHDEFLDSECPTV